MGSHFHNFIFLNTFCFRAKGISAENNNLMTAPGMVGNIPDTHAAWAVGCQRGVVETSTHVASVVRVRFPVEAGLYVMEWATLFDSVGLLRGSGFLLQCKKSPILS